ncbi:MAG: CapA family protein [Candidatus Helarchaeales archaeon]
MADEIQEEWAKERPRKKISTPYNLREKISWIKNNIFGPSRKYKELTPFIPQETVLNKITPKYKLGFIGDIMRIGPAKLSFARELKDFFKDVDFLIGNFEGTISTAKKVFMAQDHHPKILDSLSNLFPPEKTLLSCANNHSGDFGWTEFNKSYQMLKDHGFMVSGRRDEPAILLNDDLNVASLTLWSNQPCEYVAMFRDLERAFNHDAQFNVLYPHWGYEMQLYPTPKQIDCAKKLLQTWDMIVGHHSHCPQPVTAPEINSSRRLLAYSLGDFTFKANWKRYKHGIVIKVEIGPVSDGTWHAGMLNWKFSFIKTIERGKYEIILEDNCDLFH